MQSISEEVKLMAAIRLSGDCPSSQTIISNLFIDQYMPEANGEFVKVYLFLLRCYQSGEQNFSISDTADLFNITEADVNRAMKYWERKGLLLLTFGMDSSITGIRLTAADPSARTAAPAAVPAAFSPEPASPAGAPEVITAEPISAAGTPAISSVGTPAAAESPAAVSVRSGAALCAQPAPSLSSPAAAFAAAALQNPSREVRTYTADEVTMFSENPDIQELFFIIQTYLKHPLTASDTNIILFWYDELKFIPELIEYLVEYCISKGHSSTRYMNKVAISWADSGISTVEAAKENAAIHSQIYYTVMKALGICGRSLVPSETEYIARWTGEYHFSGEMIQEACARTIAATHQPSFEYTDTILSNWFKKGIRTPADVKKADEEFSRNRKRAAGSSPVSEASRPAARFNNFNQRTYDEEELEALLLNTSVGQ